MSKLPDNQLTQSVNDLIRNKTDINSISPADVADALQNIIDSKVNRNSTAQGAFKFYATYDAATQLDEYGEPIPLAVEQYEGRSYVVSNPGTVDLNGTGFFYDWKNGDIIVCLYALGTWQWVIYGNVYGGSSIPEGSTGNLLLHNGYEWVATSTIINSSGTPKADWNDDFILYDNSNYELLKGTSDGLYLYSNVGGINRLSIAVRERLLKNIGNFDRARWYDEFEVLNNAGDPIVSIGENGFLVNGFYGNPGIRYIDAFESFDINGLPIMYDRTIYNSSEMAVFDFENGLGYDNSGNYTIDLFNQQLLFEGTQKFSWDDGGATTYGDFYAKNSAGDETYLSVNGNVIAYNKFEVKSLGGGDTYFTVDAGDGVVSLPNVTYSGDDTPDTVGMFSFDNSLYAYNIRERLAFGSVNYSSGNSGTLTPIWPNSTNGSVHLTSNVATTVGADFSAKVFDSFYQTNGSNGGLFTMYLINGIAATPTVFSFDNTKYKVTGNATVGSISDSARRLIVILFAWQDGKLREITRTAGTGILLD